jgi:hypothetical protein
MEASGNNFGCYNMGSWVHVATWVLFGYGLGTVWVRFGYGLGTVWVLFGYCLGTVWVRFGYCLGTVWVLFGYQFGNWLEITVSRAKHDSCLFSML